MGHGALDWGIVAVFAVVYLGMFPGGLPRLKLSRAGVALLGAIAMIPITGNTREVAARTIDLPTVVLLVAFMVVSALLGLGVLLLSRRSQSAPVMAFVDLPLPLLFIGLFVVNHAFETTRWAAWGWCGLAALGGLTNPAAERPGERAAPGDQPPPSTLARRRRMPRSQRS